MSPRSVTQSKIQSKFSTAKPNLPLTGPGRNLPPKTADQLRAVGESTIQNPTDTPRQRAIEKEAMRIFQKQASKKQLEKQQIEQSQHDFMNKQDSLQTESFSNTDQLGMTE